MTIHSKLYFILYLLKKYLLTK